MATITPGMGTISANNMNNYDDIDEQYEETMRDFRFKFGCMKSIRIKELMEQMGKKRKLEDRRQIKRDILHVINGC